MMNFQLPQWDSSWVANGSAVSSTLSTPSMGFELWVRQEEGRHTHFQLPQWDSMPLWDRIRMPEVPFNSLNGIPASRSLTVRL